MTTASPRPKSTAHAHRAADALLCRYRDGRVFALSLSDPGATYELRPAPAGWSCACLGYSHRGSCYHADAARERFGLACWHCGADEGVERYVNPYDGGAPIALCPRCAGHA